MPPPGFQPQNPSPDPNQAPTEYQDRILSNEDIAADLTSLLEIESAHDQILKIVERAEPHERMELQRWLVELTAKGKRYFIAGEYPTPNIMKAMVEDIIGIRREILVVVLGAIGKELDKTKWEKNAFIHDKEYKGKLTIAKEIQDIEKWIKKPPDPKRRGGKSNPLYYRNNPYLPQFNVIADKAKIIDQARTKIDPSDPVRAQKTEEKLKNLKMGLAVIERIDPMGAARYQFEKERGKEKDILIGPGSIALAGFLSIMAVASGINLLTKVIKGQDLGLFDALFLVYVGLGLKVAGIDLFKEKSELQSMVNTVETIHSDEQFQTVVQKISRNNAADAAKSFYQIAKGKDEQKKALLSQALTKDGVSRETLKSFAKERSPLFAALAKDNLNDIDRKIFLKKMQTLYEQKRDIYAIIAVIKHPSIYSINEL